MIQENAVFIIAKLRKIIYEFFTKKRSFEPKESDELNNTMRKRSFVRLFFLFSLIAVFVFVFNFMRESNL